MAPQCIYAYRFAAHRLLHGAIRPLQCCMNNSQQRSNWSTEWIVLIDRPQSSCTSARGSNAVKAEAPEGGDAPGETTPPLLVGRPVMSFTCRSKNTAMLDSMMGPSSAPCIKASHGEFIRNTIRDNIYYLARLVCFDTACYRHTIRNLPTGKVMPEAPPCQRVCS